jgi:LemA protein
VEHQVAEARRYYNAVVRDFNTKTQTFPSLIVARAFGFSEREFFEVAEEERAAPEVSFD